MTSTQALLKRIADRAESEPDVVLPVLRVLAGESARRETTGEPDPALYAVALEINRARIAEGRREFIAHAWSTEQVGRHLDVNSRQAVAQRRARGGLLGVRMGRTTYYPTWQFGPDGLAPELDRLLAMLPADAVGADNIMRTKHSELGGRSLADLFQATASRATTGEAVRAVDTDDWATLEAWLGDIAGWRR